MRTLGSYTGNHDNNFNLMRALAAFAVIVSHSFVFRSGVADHEPWHAALGITPGSLAVDVFFIASGFLVTASLVHRGSVLQFVKARALRIYPALFVAVLSTTLFLGFFFGRLPFQEFVAAWDTVRYVVRNIVLVIPGGITWSVPGVFENHPSGPPINGSLWTLVEEVRMYGLLALTWLVLKLSGASPRRWIGPAALALVALGLVWHFATRGDSQLTAMPRLMAFFFAGSALYHWRDRIPASWPLFFACLAAMLLSALDRTAFGIVWPFALPYTVLFLALVPAGPIRQFNRVGDYSYGLYIYACPVQKVFVLLIPGIGPWMLTLVAGAVTLVLAVASWYLIEEPALRLKDAQWNWGRRLRGA
jgi:peptidoglycan/LPS O-acetylase OafA/YrhL